MIFYKSRDQRVDRVISEASKKRIVFGQIVLSNTTSFMHLLRVRFGGAYEAWKQSLLSCWSFIVDN